MVFGFDRGNRIYRELVTLLNRGYLSYEEVVEVSEICGYDELNIFLKTYGSSMYSLMLDVIPWEEVETLECMCELIMWLWRIDRLINKVENLGSCDMRSYAKFYVEGLEIADDCFGEVLVAGCEERYRVVK